MGKYYKEDTLFCWLRIQPDGIDIQLPVYNLKKKVRTAYGPCSEYVEFEGQQWLLPENWPHFCHAWEIDRSKIEEVA